MTEIKATLPEYRINISAGEAEALRRQGRGIIRQYEKESVYG